MRVERIGNAELWLGDCRELLPTLDRVDHVICDPPFDKEAHQPNRRARRGGLVQGAPLDFAPLSTDLRTEVCMAVKRLCTGWLIAFCQTEQAAGWRDAIEAAELKYKSPMIWVKPDSAPKFNGQGPAIGYESMVTAWCGTGYARWNGGGKRGVFTHCTNQPDRHGVHMTEKPIPLMKELISLFTNPGDLVLDPFLGSGTTGIACARLGRRFVGCETDERYFDIACERISEAQRQPDMFVSQPKAAVQEALL